MLQVPGDALTSPWDAPEARALLEALREGKAAPPPGGAAALLAFGERHGVGGVVLDRLVASGWRPPADALARDVARELDHEAHLATLRRIDAALARAGLRAVALKGAALAARLYPRPAARATSDVDLLVAEDELDDVARVLGEDGWRGEDSPSERRFRREHFHLHFTKPGAPPLELHFHAYRGFGHVMRSEPMIARAVPALGLEAVRVAAPEDEIPYLAAHAAAHRFVRLGWLWDLALYVDHVSDATLAAARRRAEERGFARVLGFTAAVLEERLGRPRARLLAEDNGGRGRALEKVRRLVVSAIAEEPREPVARSLTRFVFTTLLCDDAASAVRYARTATAERVRAAFGAET